MQLQKIISTFHKLHPEKLIATSVPLDFVPLIVKLIVKFSVKRKWGHLAKITKYVK